MSVQLEIRDGDPWWLSPDLWVVPGPDPLGTPGSPIAGTPAYIWARVRNTGDTPVVNAEVRYYWADPSTAFDRNTANTVGSAFVTLQPGEIAEVLLLIPWIPEFVNNGHECILAEAFHPLSDPLPPSPTFNTPTDRHVAQRNLTVLMASIRGFFSVGLSQVNTSRLDAKFRLVAELAPLILLKPLIKPIGLEVDLSSKPGKLTHLGFVDDACPNEADLKRKLNPEIHFEINGHRKTRRSLIGHLEGGPALIHVKQYHGERLVGGQSVLVLPPEGSVSKPKSAKTKSARGSAS